MARGVRRFGDAELEPEVLDTDIELTRRELANTLDELVSKAHLGRRLRSAARTAVRRIRRTGGVWWTVLLAAGGLAGWLVRRRTAH